MTTVRRLLPLRRRAVARVIFFLLLISSSALAARVERLIDTWKPQHYLVNIKLNDQLTEITAASTRIDVRVLRPTRVIDFDFGELTVDRVTRDRFIAAGARLGDPAPGLGGDSASGRGRDPGFWRR